MLSKHVFLCYSISEVNGNNFCLDHFWFESRTFFQKWLIRDSNWFFDNSNPVRFQMKLVLKVIYYLKSLWIHKKYVYFLSFCSFPVAFASCFCLMISASLCFQASKVMPWSLQMLLKWIKFWKQFKSLVVMSLNFRSECKQLLL